jgi:uncharacterized membrane protein YbhN (UPF0104 family)
VTSRDGWAWLRLLVGAVILGLLVARLGAGPFLDALARAGPAALGVGVVVTALTTVCCAWRWIVVSRGLGVELRLGPAVAACYRSQLLNATLPGGVLGDVHRGVRTGRDVGDVGNGLRAVARERAAGQVVQISATGLLLLVLPSPVRTTAPRLVLGTALTVLVAVLATRALRTGSLSELSGSARLARAVSAEVRAVLMTRAVLPVVVLTSLVSAAGHTVVFLVAARAAGVDAPSGTLLPLALVVLLAAAVPTNVAGWGPREGMAAWVFGSAGLGAAQGVTAAAVYGVVALVAVLPGVAVLLATRRTTSGPAVLVVPVLEVAGRG